MRQHVTTGLWILIFCTPFVLGIFHSKNILLLNLGLVRWQHSELAEGDPELAISALSRTQAGKGIRTWALGNAYWQSKEYQAAQKIWDPVADGQHMIQLANYFFQRQDEQQAVDWLMRAEVSDFCLADVWFTRGQYAASSKNWTQALKNYEEALKFPITSCDHHGHSDVLYHMALLWQHSIEHPDLEAAIELYRKSITRDDFANKHDKANALYKLGQILYVRGAENDAEVIAMLEQSLALRPKHSWANLVLGRAVYRHTEDFHKAEEFLSRGLAMNNTNWRFHFYLAELYDAEGLIDQATEHYQQTLLLAPENLQAQQRLERLQP
ncbi:MAG: hypothetical protein AAF702_04060 [Chloroflexota bacterium]